MTAAGSTTPDTEDIERRGARIRVLHLPKIKPSKLVMPIATGFGLWLLVQQLIGIGEIRTVLDSASWGWVVVVLVVTQATSFTEAVAMSGAAPVDLALGPLTLLRFAMAFTGMIGGTVGTTATLVRFFRQRALEPAVALSSGILYSLSGFAIQILLTLLILPFVWGDLHITAAGPSGSGPEILQILLWALTAAGLVGGIVFMVPKLRRIVSSRVKPQFHDAWANVRAVSRQPRRVVLLLTGAAATQLLMAGGLGLSLRAVGAHAGFAQLVMICTFTALLGGMAPVPGGMGVMEACYISGLTLVGVPQDLAVAAVFLYRACTTYLPPFWGWVAMVVLRRRGYL
jgi:uncharacterized membrane protein YbhN (UPF0104 family)